MGCDQARTQIFNFDFPLQRLAREARLPAGNFSPPQKSVAHHTTRHPLGSVSSRCLSRAHHLETNLLPRRQTMRRISALPFSSFPFVIFISILVLATSSTPVISQTELD